MFDCAKPVKDRELRVQLVQMCEDPLSLLRSVKPLPLIRPVGGVTISATAEWFEANKSLIYNTLNSKKSDFSEKDIVRYSMGDVMSGGGWKYIRKDTATISVFDEAEREWTFSTSNNVLMPTALLRLALLLRNCPVAVSVREKLSDLYKLNTMVSDDTISANPEGFVANEVLGGVIRAEEAIELNDLGDDAPGYNVYSNPAFGRVRVKMIDDEPWFVGKDVADALGYKNTRDAMAKHVSEDDKNTVAIRSGYPGNPEIVVINESGVYSLIMGSELPTAKQYKHWVTHEVLPSIRKHGAYMTPETLEQAMDDPDFLIGLATRLKEERAKRVAVEAKLEEASAQLTETKEELTKTKTAYELLLNGAREWGNDSVCNALIRKIAYVQNGNRIDGRYQRSVMNTWGEFYRELYYSCRIDVKKRKVPKGRSRLASIRDNEWPKVLRVLATMSEDCLVDIVATIKEYNASRIEREQAVAEA